MRIGMGLEHRKSGNDTCSVSRIAFSCQWILELIMKWMFFHGRLGTWSQTFSLGLNAFKECGCHLMVWSLIHKLADKGPLEDRLVKTSIPTHGWHVTEPLHAGGFVVGVGLGGWWSYRSS